MSNPAGTPGPFSEHLGLELVRADPDGAHLEAVPSDEHCNGGGILHGGYLSALLDSVTGWAVHAADPDDGVWPHVQINVQFLRAGLPHRPIVATARCTSTGRRLATAEGELRQDERVIARATSTHAVLRGRSRPAT